MFHGASLYPRAGRLLVLDQGLPHHALPSQPGACKYFLRSEVMFERVEPLPEDGAAGKAMRLYLDAIRLMQAGHMDASAAAEAEALENEVVSDLVLLQ